MAIVYDNHPNLITAGLDHTRNEAEDETITTGAGAWYGPLKAAAERLAAALLLVLTAPLILALLALVRITSAGPALYAQVRLGRGGRPYTLYKIRSMRHDCERLSGPQWSTPGDPRVTALGRFLRDCHLDELPQLWNVVRGEMSLVGPRPERPVIAEQLERVIPRYRERLRVLPGITGLAQIQLPPDEDIPGVRRKLAYDLCYIERMGPWLDARVILGTALKLSGVPARWRRRMLRLPDAAASSRESPDPSSGLSGVPPQLRSA